MNIYLKKKRPFTEIFNTLSSPHFKGNWLNDEMACYSIISTNETKNLRTLVISSLKLVLNGSMRIKYLSDSDI